MLWFSLYFERNFASFSRQKQSENTFRNRINYKKNGPNRFATKLNGTMRLFSLKYFPNGKVQSRSNIPETSFAIVRFEEKFCEWFRLEEKVELKSLGRVSKKRFFLRIVTIKVNCYDVTHFFSLGKFILQRPNFRLISHREYRKSALTTRKKKQGRHASVRRPDADWASGRSVRAKLSFKFVRVSGASKYQWRCE